MNRRLFVMISYMAVFTVTAIGQGRVSDINLIMKTSQFVDEVKINDGLMERDVLTFYGLESKYNTPLKRKLFKQSEEYQQLLSSLDKDRANVLKKSYYYIKDVNGAEYDLRLKAFLYKVGSKWNMFAADNFLIRSKYFHSRDSVMVPMANEMKALEVENALDNVSLMFVFRINEEMSYTRDKGVFVCNNYKLILFNRESKKVYAELDDMGDNKQESEEWFKNNPSAFTNSDFVYDIVDEMPSFPGGMGALMSCLAQNIKYPVEAAEKKIEGRVVVKFIVAKDGSISNAVVEKSAHPILDREALRVVTTMPRWIPGRMYGEPVNVYYTVPISFRQS